jgi:Fe2+ transport system protein FeoA
VNLNEVKKGQAVVFSGFSDSSEEYVEMLSSRGLVPGTLCRLERFFPLGGIVQLNVRGSMLGLRMKEAKHLIFECANEL